jgi:hypothetical protein
MAELLLMGDIMADWDDVAFSLKSMAMTYEPNSEVDVIDIFWGEPQGIVANSSEVSFVDRLRR